MGAEKYLGLVPLILYPSQLTAHENLAPILSCQLVDKLGRVLISDHLDWCQQRLAAVEHQFVVVHVFVSQESLSRESPTKPRTI